jgi:O-antigen/teichoic acid export membrane protein
MKDLPENPLNATPQTPEGRQEALEQPHGLDSRILRSSAWVALSYGGRNVLTMLSTLLLARLLVPHDFGVVALASTFVLILEHVQSSGLAASIVYRRTDVERAAATALVFAAVAGAGLCVANFAAAPLVARLFHVPEAAHVMQAMSLLFVIRGLGTGAGAILERNLDFRTRAKGELAAGATQVTVSIALAVTGAGVWSLVVGQLAAAAVQSAAFWLLAPWRPHPRHASWGMLREMMRYGRFISAGSILGLINETIDNMFVARLLGARALGFYAMTFRLADFPTGVIGHVVGRVMFPAYSSVQEDLPAFRRAFVQNLQRVALLVLPIAVTLGIAARPLVLGLLGEKWLPTVAPMRILAVYTVVRGFASCAGPLFQALGRPQFVFFWSIPHTVVVVPALFLLVPPLGLKGAALSMVAAFTASGLPAFVHALRLLDLGPAHLGRHLARPVACSAILAAGLALLLPVVRAMPQIPGLIFVLASGALIYVAAAAIIARATWVPMWVGLRRSGNQVAQ